MTQKEINIEINLGLKDSNRNMQELVEEVSYENQISEVLVNGIIEKMIKQGWITRNGETISLRFPYSVY